MFIKRKIPVKIDDNNYYDIVTPYGYGGPNIIKYDGEKKDELIDGFINAFSKYCKQSNIISEFVRFHPLFNNVRGFEEYYETSHIRNTVGTDLMSFDDPFQQEFSKSCRKNVRRALKNNVNYNIIKNPSEVTQFQKFYYSTMDRNNAQEYYYFDESYFNKCKELFGDNLLIVEANYEDKTIAMGFYFIYKNFIHIHLSGTLSEYLHLSPAYILRYGVTQWGKENGYHMIHHGGGRTNALDDSLYKFKKQFGRNTEFEFHIGKKVWNKEIYTKLCNEVNVDKEVDFFPAYRFTQDQS